MAFSALNLLPVEPQGSRVIDYVPPPDIAQTANPAMDIGVPVADTGVPQAKFDLEKTQAQAMLFSTAYTDPVKVGEIGVLNYYSTFMGKNIPQDFRIADYVITDIQLPAGDIQEVCVLVTANYFANSMFFFSANGHFRPVEGGYRCEGDVTQFRVKSLGGDKFEIIGIGTGGLDAGLIPIAGQIFFSEDLSPFSSLPPSDEVDLFKEIKNPRLNLQNTNKLVTSLLYLYLS